MTGQRKVVQQATPTDGQDLGEVALFDEEGNPLAGTADQLTTGTDDVPRLWSAADIAAYVAAVHAG